MTSVPRALVQPGTPHPVRVASLEGDGLHLSFPLEAGKSLRDALIGPLQAAGIQGATVRMEGVRMRALHYVRPAMPKPDDDQHVAFYSDTHHIDHPVTLTLACATIGRKDGAPFVHCHAIWEDEHGREHGGHLFNELVIVDAPATARAWGLPDVIMQADFDSETNFTLFHPVQADALPAATAAQAQPAGRCVIAKICPNEDLVRGIEAACRLHGMAHAKVRGSVGSTVGAAFEDGSTVADIATEILVVDGEIHNAGDAHPDSRLDIALIDPRGAIHRGRLKRGANPVLICFELVLEELPGPAPASAAGAALQ